MTYCINSECPSPKNPSTARECLACGSTLLLRDRYRVSGALGKGGFGTTFLAHDEGLPGCPPCVIKQLQPTTAAPHVMQMARDLFAREAKILGKIGNHPQLPRLLDYFEARTDFFLVQEYIHGATLQKEVKTRGAFSEAGTKQFLSEILPVMQYIHRNQVIHRDIKPANLIRRDADKRLVLIDFGAVKDKVNPVKANEESGHTALTAYAVGTPGYAPPEQMAMRPVYASDIYAIGVTCLYLLTAKSPKEMSYDPQSGEILWQQHVKVSEHFAGVLSKMLEISVRHRYSSADAILRDLDLEPYLHSLAQNMAIPTTAPKDVGPTSQPTFNSDDTASVLGLDDSTSGASPSARLAAAIRARRERRQNTKGASPIAPRRSAGNLLSSSSSQSGPFSGQGKKITPEAVQKAYERGHRDFSLQNFGRLNLQRMVLSGASFAGAQLMNCALQGADLTNVNLSKADLRQCNLKNAKLSNAYMGEANLENSDLRGANLNRSNLAGANLKGVNLCGADLTGANLTEAQLATTKTNWSTIYPNGRRGLR
ncbi:pentapeptide repeat-containing protein [Leptolyngbya cf. ectocarpi LEGE 11479]|uniref:Serine/threonine-protein kinase B n=1 Tax=Leptolyngbya cf. ectocarpi LEGE 11479 TaxID=1828722 RepID=A0A928ZVP6_LEPEC|nr:serine/threonine-protein kinase [Leptolyngbya ectocarpi]MBE9068337.1 pentapeptide repeat-containing protein [Leptolyngbya cf. ectocarpi LEGE 11479]